MRALHRATIALLLTTLVTAPVWAQSDADKATARTLAEEGIALKQAQKYEEALDKLTRAQQIFDAPTHLLLIGQCQVALGKLVEGAETFRRLQRSKLDAGAPPAFVSAKKQADDELRAVEPRIPKVRIKLVPEEVEGFEVRIDGVVVPAAVVGVDRVANPGHHVVEVSAPGYRKAQVQLQLTESQVLPVEVRLERDGTPLASATPPPTYTPAPPPKPVDSPPSDGSRMDFLLTARLQLAWPGGDFGTNTFGASETQAAAEIRGGAVSESFGSGGGLELQGGLRFGDHFAALLLFGVDGFGKVSSDRYSADLEVLYEDAAARSFEAKESTAPYGGIGAQWQTCRDCFGFVGEVALMLRRFTQTVEYEHLTERKKCEISVVRNAPMLRAMAGLQVPLAADLNLMPFASISGGSVATTDLEPSEDPQLRCQTDSRSAETVEGSVVLFTLGLSGTMAFEL